MQRTLLKLGLIWLLALVALSPAQEAALPPELPWDGKSKKFISPADDKFLTVAEKSNFEETPSYQESIDWLEALVEQSNYLTMHSIGKSSQGRDIWMIVVSSNAAVSEEDLDDSKPTVLFHAGIHSGEIDGKDAGMMFLRDVVRKHADLLQKINMLFIPVINPDGHEMISSHNRVNQRGPSKMGWRTNARNLNLNRDFSKIETPDLQALLGVFNNWPVDLYIDFHVTDGVDYQYDITFGYNVRNTYSPHMVEWLQKELTPAVYSELEDYDHIPGPLLLALDGRNPAAGVFDWTASQRFSNGYGDARHLPSILVENHSLKNYRQRVLGTYVFLKGVMEKIAKDGLELRSAVEKDKTLRPAKLPMNWQWDFKNRKPEVIKLLGVDYEMYDSPISGVKEVRWLGTKKDVEWPLHYQKAVYVVDRPRAYWIPLERSDIVEKLRIHGIEMENMSARKDVELTMYRLPNATLAEQAFEGRVRVTPGEILKETHQVDFKTGAVRVPTDQPLGDLAMLLLEPYGEDSFLQWGYFHEISQRTEYIEGYVVEPLAQKMLAADPDLKRRFDEALLDEAFAKSADARLRWFYEQSPYYDPYHNLYPIGREE